MSKATAKAPRNPPKGGKGSVLTTRITGELREALDAEVERSGRSLSQVAEQWLEEARSGHALAAINERLDRIEAGIRGLAAGAGRIGGRKSSGGGRPRTPTTNT